MLRWLWNLLLALRKYNALVAERDAWKQKALDTLAGKKTSDSLLMAASIEIRRLKEEKLDKTRQQ